MDKCEIGKKIRRRRQALDMTQKQLGDLMGITRQAVCNYETGDNLPNDDKKMVLAKILHTTVSELFFT